MRETLTRRGLSLEYTTLGWNVVGVPVLAVAAIRSRSAAAAGFGFDSAIEIGASLVVVWELTGAPRERESRGLRLIGCAFVALAVYVTAQAAYTVIGGHHPEPSPLGIAWTAATCLVMLALARGKAVTGKALGNPVLQAEGRVTLVDACLAAAVLLGLTLNALTGWWWADPLAGLVIVAYAIREARITLTPNKVSEQQLDGGIANAGEVVRVGPHVLRPSGPHSESVHAFLRAVRHAGFEGASLPVGIDDDGRERLEFIDGDVPLTPYPDWSQSDTALASIARLLRGLHDAARRFDPQGFTWNDALADPAGGTLVCHNDVEPSNVVFRDGIAVALLDFEFAAPGRPVYDVAQLARLCVPIDDDFDQARLGWRPADRPARLRLVADAYGLNRHGRAELLTAINDAIDCIEAAVRRSVDAGDPNSVAMWNRTGGSERFDRRRRWWMDHHDQFAAALL